MIMPGEHLHHLQGFFFSVSEKSPSTTVPNSKGFSCVGIGIEKPSHYGN